VRVVDVARSLLTGGKIGPPNGLEVLVTGTIKFNKVFGIGLSRTGTFSLACALGCLGIPTINFPEDQTTFEQLRSGDFSLRVLNAYAGACDTPVVQYYPQLDKAFPRSKFVLTVRSDTEAWLTSVEKLWRSISDMEENPYTRFVNTAVYGTWGFSRSRFRWVYETHHRNVLRYFADRPDDLLELDICAGEGWSKLAPFLGLDPPTVPFPHRDILHAEGSNV
jgi:hypothetical protein